MELKVRLCAVLLSIGLWCLCLAAQDTFKAPEPRGEHFFAESFGEGTLDGWVLSSAKKEGAAEDIARYDGEWEVEEMKRGKVPGDKGLVLKSQAKHHAISAPFARPFVFDTEPLIVQYEVNFQTVPDCGGAYLKLLTQTPDLDLKRFADTTPYTIMFGPDKCGKNYKLHFIFRHKNPKTGKFEEKHAKKSGTDLESYFLDKKTHLYTLVVKPDNSFEILVDQGLVNSGNLLTDMTPSVNPPAEIEDPDDHEPDDQGEKTKNQKSDAVKSDDLSEDSPTPVSGTNAASGDNTETAANEEAVEARTEHEDEDEDDDVDDDSDDRRESRMDRRREDMDHEGDGVDEDTDEESEAAWKPRKIPNPDFFEDLHPFRMSPIGAVGLELWSTSSDIFFDNFLVTSDNSTAEHWAKDGWALKKAAEDRPEEEDGDEVGDDGGAEAENDAKNQYKDEDEDEDEDEDDDDDDNMDYDGEDDEDLLPLRMGDGLSWTVLLYIAVASLLATVLIGALRCSKRPKKTCDKDSGDYTFEEDSNSDSGIDNKGVRTSIRRRRRLEKVQSTRLMKS